MIDLHTHSSFSDGSEPPERIPELAAAAGCSAVALTDHDGVAGLDRARAAARRVGVELVPGCEVSCRKPLGADGTRAPGSMHVLCYFVAPAPPEAGDDPLLAELAHLRDDRRRRNLALVERLGELGVPLGWDEVVAEAGTEEGVGRPHFARVLVRHGHAADLDDAFDRFLADGRPGYVAKGRLEGGDVARLARRSGAVAVLAHPLSLGLDPSGLEAVVAGLAAEGLAGIEALYGRYDPDERRRLRRLAERHGLVATGGSDFHGSFKPDLAVGTGTGDLHVPDEVLEALRTCTGT